MKLISIEFGQVVWLLNFTVPSGSLYLPEVMRKINDRYGFVRSPDIEELLHSGQSISFEHGKYKKSVIRKFSVHDDGLIAESQAGTECAEEFLDDCMDWFEGEFGASRLDIGEPYKIYESQLVVQMDVDLKEYMEFTNSICAQINQFSLKYGLGEANYEPTGFVLNSGISNRAGMAPMTFRVEPRAGHPLERNLYFCTAPLKTSDHKSILSKVEKLL